MITIVVMDKQQYIDKMDEHINKVGYQKLDQNPTSFIRNKILKIAKPILKKSSINKDIITYSLLNNNRTPVLYGLPKLHKNDIPIRPIVSACSSPTDGLSWIIRPILEYASCVWSPSSVYASTELEKVQQRFTKGINGLSNLQYEQRLDRLQLDTLAHRRHISDLILAFKSLHGNVSVLPELLGLQLSDAPTRSFV